MMEERGIGDLEVVDEFLRRQIGYVPSFVKTSGVYHTLNTAFACPKFLSSY